MRFFKNRSMFLSFKSWFKAYRLPALSGLLLGASFIPFPFFALLFALVPLWLFIYRQKSFKKVLVGCLTAQFLSALIGFNWVIYTFHYFGGMSWPISFLLLLGFCFIPSLYLSLSGLLWFFIIKKSPRSLSVPVKLLLFPLIFSILHSLIPTVFPWNMGYPWLWGGLPGAQTAELWGFRFLNSLFYVFNLLFLILFKHADFSKLPELKQSLFHLFARQKKEGRESSSSAPSFWRFSPVRLDRIGRWSLVSVITLFVFLNGLGFYLKQRLPEPVHFLNVIVAQNNIGSVSFLDPKPFKDPRRKAFQISKSLTYRAVFRHARKKAQRQDINFIIWSEGSYPYSISKKSNREGQLSKIAKTIQIPLITGAVGKASDKYSSSLFVFDREGYILKPTYDKIKLVIFGEYFPGLDRFPILRQLFPYFGQGMTPGKETMAQTLEGVKFGWQICYESLFDWMSRQTALKGAEVLVNVTNDSWYGSWQEPMQHLIMNFARAIEVRRPLIRSANTGYSGVIHADGSIDRVSPFNKPWFHLYKVPYYETPPKTLFMGWGYWINEIFLSILALVIIARVYFTRSSF